MEVLLIETLYNTSDYVTRVFSDGDISVVVTVTPSVSQVFPALKDGHIWHWYTDELLMSDSGGLLLEGQRALAMEGIYTTYLRMNDE